MPVIGILILLVPLVELIVIVQVAERIGIPETILLLIAISIAGAWLLRREGTAAWRRLTAAMQRGEIPTDQAVDGALILFGGALLLTPGFLTDIVGLGLIFPPSRALLRRGARKWVAFIALRRFGAAGAATAVGKRVYDARVTKRRTVDDTATTPTPTPIPSDLEHRSDAGDSPDRG